MIANGKKFQNDAFMVKSISYTDIIENCRDNVPFNLYALVIREYFRIVAKTLLNGYAWKFSKGIGEVMVVKKSMTLKLLSARKKIVQPKLGFYYIGFLKSVFLDENGMTFILADKLRLQVESIVKSKKRDYRYEC